MNNQATKKNEIDIFVERLKKIGITIELAGNIPWIYLNKVNGNKIQREDFINANHGYTVAWYGVRYDSKPHLNWDDMKTTFKLIRKYKNIKQ
jgi:hypothetical protein